METTNVGRLVLDVTNGGLEIFRRYVNTKFEVDKEAVVDENRKFIVKWNLNYLNYVLYLDERIDGRWFVKSKRFNGIYFVQETFNLTKDQALSKIDSDLNLGIIQPQKVELSSEQIDQKEQIRLKNEILINKLG